MNVIQLSEISTNSYNLSDISLSPHALSSNPNQNGGFFWSASGGNINDINYKDASVQQAQREGQVGRTY